MIRIEIAFSTVFFQGNTILSRMKWFSNTIAALTFAIKSLVSTVLTAMGRRLTLFAVKRSHIDAIIGTRCDL
jgi:hypothetical protein